MRVARSHFTLNGYNWLCVEEKYSYFVNWWSIFWQRRKILSNYYPAGFADTQYSSLLRISAIIENIQNVWSLDLQPCNSDYHTFNNNYVTKSRNWTIWFNCKFPNCFIITNKPTVVPLVEICRCCNVFFYHGFYVVLKICVLLVENHSELDMFFTRAGRNYYYSTLHCDHSARL